MNLWEAVNFSREAKPLLEREIIGANLERRRQQLTSNIEKLRAQNKKTADTSQVLLANILADHLRMLDLNYSYTVFLREANIRSEDVVLRQDLLALTNLQQSSKLNRLDFDSRKSVLQILYEASRRWEVPVTDGQSQTIEVSEQPLPESYYDAKLKSLKEELERVAKVEKESIRAQVTAQLKLSIRESLMKEFDESFQKRKHQQEKQTNAMQEKMLKLQENLQLKYSLQVKSLEESLQQTRKQCEALKAELRESLKKVQQHKCVESKDYLEALNALKEQTKRMKEKEMDYKLALANINTTVQDILQKKEALLQSEDRAFQQRADKTRRAKGIDDQAAKALLVAISNIEARVKLLSDENHQLREELDNRNRKVFQLDRELSSIQQEYVNSQMSLEISGVKPSPKRPTKSIGLHVYQALLNPPAQEASSESLLFEEQRQREQEELLAYIEEVNRKKLEAVRNIDSLKMDMGRIKRRVRFLIEDPL